MEEKYIHIMGIDMGIKNFAVWIDKINYNKLIQLKDDNIPLSKRYNKNKECSEEFSTFLKKFFLIGERIFVDKINLTTDKDKKRGNKTVISNSILIRLSNYLEDLNEKKLFDNIDYFVLEQQMKTNPTAQQIQYHVRAYLLLLFLNFKPIISFPSKYKTQIFGAPKLIYNANKKKMVKLGPKKKKWASDKVLEILTNRGDNNTVDLLFNKKKFGKSDDCSDCLLEIMAFVYMVFIDNKTEILDC